MNNRLVKVIIWRIISISITMAVMLALTGDVKSATSLTLFLHFVLTIANYFFEFFWDKIKSESNTRG